MIALRCQAAVTLRFRHPCAKQIAKEAGVKEGGGPPASLGFFSICLIAFVLGVVSRSSAYDEIPLFKPEESVTMPDLVRAENTLKASVVDIDVREDENLLLAASTSKIFLFSLPDFRLKQEIKARGEALNAGFLQDSSSRRILFFVVAAYGDNINTYFYEFLPTPGTVRRTGYDRSAFYRTADGALLRQKLGMNAPFEGPVVVSILNRSGSPEPKFELPLPQKPRLYAFARGHFLPDSEKSSFQIARIESDRRLVLYEGRGKSWRERWKSAAPFGGSLTTVTAFDRKGVEERNQGLMAVNLDRDDDMELLAVVHRKSPNPVRYVLGKKYDSVKVVALEGRNGGLGTLWETSWVEGTVPNIAKWRDHWIMPVVQPDGKTTRFFINPFSPAESAASVAKNNGDDLLKIRRATR